MPRVLVFLLVMGVLTAVMCRSRDLVEHAAPPAQPEPRPRHATPTPASPLTPPDSVVARTAVQGRETTPRASCVVLVRTLTSPSRFGTPVPRIAFELLGRRPRRPSTAERASLPPLPLLPCDPPLLRGRTDEHGEARVTLELGGGVDPEGIPLLCAGVVEPGERLQGKRFAPSEVLFDVEEGTRVLVGVLGAGFDGTLREIEVRPEDDQIVVEFRASEPEPLGAVAVRLYRSGGEGEVTSNDFELRLESLEHGAPLLRKAADGPPPHRFDAPAGRYRIAAAGTATIEAQHGRLSVPRALGRAQAEVEIRAGRTQEIALWIDEGARLELTLEGRATDADLAVPEDWFGFDDEKAPRTARATLTLLTPERAPEPVFFAARAYRNSSAAGTHLLKEWPLLDSPAEARVSERLPSGRHTLVGRLPGGREARAEVELVPGATTRVTLRF